MQDQLEYRKPKKNPLFIQLKTTLDKDRFLSGIEKGQYRIPEILRNLGISLRDPSQVVKQLSFLQTIILHTDEMRERIQW